MLGTGLFITHLTTRGRASQGTRTSLRTRGWKKSKARKCFMLLLIICLAFLASMSPGTDFLFSRLTSLQGSSLCSIGTVQSSWPVQVRIGRSTPRLDSHSIACNRYYYYMTWPASYSHAAALLVLHSALKSMAENRSRAWPVFPQFMFLSFNSLGLGQDISAASTIHTMVVLAFFLPTHPAGPACQPWEHQKKIYCYS